MRCERIAIMPRKATPSYKNVLIEYILLLYKKGLHNKRHAVNIITKYKSLQSFQYDSL